MADTDTIRPSRVHIIANPVSGFGRSRRLAEELSGLLAARGLRPVVDLTGRPGDALRSCRGYAREADVIVSVGGDGTLNEVANGLLGADIPVAVLPMGTANVLAKEFGIRRDVRRIADDIACGRTTRIDAGLCGKRLFLCVAGVGFDAAVARAYAGARRGTGRYVDYAIPMLQALADYRFPELDVSAESGAGLEGATWTLVTNTRSFGGPLWFCDRADPADGRLDLLAIRRRGFVNVARYMALALLHRFCDAPDVTHRSGKRFEVRPRRGDVPFQVDGDFAGFCTPDDPAVFEVVPQAFRLILPGTTPGKADAKR